MKFIVDLTLAPEHGGIVVADWLLNLLTNQDDKAPYQSCDSVEPVVEPVMDGPLAGFYHYMQSLSDD